MTEYLIDSTELGQRLGVHQYTIVIMAKDGRLPHYKIGKEYRFNYNDVLKALAVNNSVMNLVNSEASNDDK